VHPCDVPRAHAKPSSTVVSQSSSDPLQTSVVVAVHVPHVQLVPHVCVPAHPPVAVHPRDVPRTHSIPDPSSVAPLQSSSTALHASAAPGFTVRSPSLQSPPHPAPGPYPSPSPSIIVP
jgi:hypothetical protein